MLRETSYYTADELLDLGLGCCGQDVLVSRRASIYGAGRVELGSHVRIDDFVVLATGEGGRIRTGSYVHIAAHAALFGGGGIVLDDFTSVSGRSSLYSASDDYGGDYLVNPTVPDNLTHVMFAPIHLRRHVALGAGTIVLPGVTIGEGSATGALTLVTRDLDPWGVYIGSPARLLRARSRRLLELEAELALRSGGLPDQAARRTHLRPGDGGES